MKNIANADRPKSVGAMLPPRPLRRSGKVAQTACNSDRREGKSCIPTLKQTFADSRILKISKFRTFRIAVDGRKPDEKYWFRDAAGAVLFGELQWRRLGCDKHVRPCVYTRDGWRAEAPASPRAMFNLDKLAAAQDALVILFE